MSYFKEQGYSIGTQIKKDVTTSEDSQSLYATVYLHNAGSSIIYFDKKTGVDNTMWEIAPGEKMGPFYFQTLYFKGAGTSTLKILPLEGV